LLRKRILLGTGGALVLLVVVLMATGYAAKWTRDSLNAAEQMLQRASGYAGLTVRRVYLEGRERMPMEDVRALIKVTPGESLMLADIDAIRERLSGAPWVERAEVQRSLSGILHVRIVERRPMAIWQHDGEHFLVDQHGVVIQPVRDLAKNTHHPLTEHEALLAQQAVSLPLLIGAGAPEHWSEILSLMTVTPSLFARVHSVWWVGERRWDVVFFDGTRVLLPQDGLAESWQRLAKLVDDGILEKSASRLDLRDPERLFVLPDYQHVPEETTVPGDGSAATLRRAVGYAI
jgi:cell division protein FtsQ